MMEEVFVRGAWHALNNLSGKLLEPLWTQGTGLLETMRWEHQGFPLKTYHEQRILQSLELLQWPKLNFIDLWEQVYEGLLQKRLENQALKIRLTFFPSTLDQGRTEWLMQMAEAPPLGRPSKALVQVGIKTLPVGCVGSFLGLKTMNRLAYHYLAQNSESFETLWNHPEWGLLEGKISNIWLWMGQNRWLIPFPLGQVQGVMHQWLLDYSRTKGWEVQQKHLLPEILESIQGIWLTNSLRGIVPVDELEGKKLNSPNPLAVLKSCFNQPRANSL
jgi:branched-subunit amino acid aminotransferase/4-amino-4-deoxychorismate lyase